MKGMPTECWEGTRALMDLDGGKPAKHTKRLSWDFFQERPSDAQVGNWGREKVVNVERDALAF